MSLQRIYATGEMRHKHHWSQPSAGFVAVGRGFIGKCPATLSHAQAQVLLEQGLAYPDEQQPLRIYNVFLGVIYEAVSANDGTWHGYPWRLLPGRNVLPRTVQKVLRERAVAAGDVVQFDQWMKHYG